MAKVMILAVFLASVWLGFGLSEAIAWFPITSFLYPTCHCCSIIGQTNGVFFGIRLVLFLFVFGFDPIPGCPSQAISNDTSHSPVGLKVHGLQSGTK